MGDRKEGSLDIKKLLFASGGWAGHPARRRPLWSDRIAIWRDNQTSGLKTGHGMGGLAACAVFVIFPVERFAMRVVIFAISLLVFVVPAHAAEPVIIPPVNFEGARMIALQRDPGNVVESYIRKADGGGTLYEFNIRREADGTLVEIEILGETGVISSYRILKLGPGARLPAPALSQEEAEAIAVRYVDKAEAGMEKPVIKQAEYTLHDGYPVYKVTATKFFKDYTLFIDPSTGDILSLVKKD
jgi:uncharacterized membrane protein YkoI